MNMELPRSTRKHAPGKPKISPVLSWLNKRPYISQDKFPFWKVYFRFSIVSLKGCVLEFRIRSWHRTNRLSCIWLSWKFSTKGELCTKWTTKINTALQRRFIVVNMLVYNHTSMEIRKVQGWSCFENVQADKWLRCVVQIYIHSEASHRYFHL